MNKKILIILFVLLLIPVVNAIVHIQVSTDNVTWTNITYVNEYYGQAFETNLTRYNNYYFRAKNSTTDWAYSTLIADYEYGGWIKMTPIMLGIFLSIAFVFIATALLTKTPVFFWVTSAILLLIAGVLLGQGISVEAGVETDSADVGIETKVVTETHYDYIKNSYTNGLAVILGIVALFLAIISFAQRDYMGEY